MTSLLQKVATWWFFLGTLYSKVNRVANICFEFLRRPIGRQKNYSTRRSRQSKIKHSPALFRLPQWGGEDLLDKTTFYSFKAM